MPMNTSLLLSCLILACSCVTTMSAAQDTRCFEMRIYYAPPGKLNDLNARFRNHTLRLFEKHGIENIGYWMPIDNPDNKLVYVLASPSREARDKSWKEFFADPDWQSAAKASEANGKLVSKVESLFLTATDYSPAISPSVGKGSRVFELRTYAAGKDLLPNLNARFRDHTLKLFEKHGMQNFGYWNLMSGQKNADVTLVYLLAHKSKEAAAESFKTFRADPDWVAARKASEETAKGSLTIPDGVKSEFLVPTDYSPTR
ncbi:MAG: NIPSNAP family protein [Opitutaceae bacterium]|nr:NIPSNAP family protein [Verrucomicrobiales bacterium]